MTQKNGRIQAFLHFSLIVLFFATPCLAQETPAWEIFTGYSFQRSDMRTYFKSTPIIYTPRGRYLNLGGWEASVTENVNHWLAGTLDISGHYKSPQILGVTNREVMYSILYGPRISYRTRWAVPFGHVLMGAAHANVKVTPVGPHASDTSFAVAVGGGLDLNLGGKATVRVFQTDYFRTNILGTRPDGLRASAGVVFYLGKGK